MEGGPVAGDPETNSSVKATPVFPDRIVGGCVAGWCHCHREGGEVGGNVRVPAEKIIMCLRHDGLIGPAISEAC
jgi:hypothetical protein